MRRSAPAAAQSSRRRGPQHSATPAILALALLAAHPASAQHLPAVEADHYARCMDEARQNPSAAWDDALAWRDTGGGHPAEHCAAVALIGLKQYDEAGKRLEKLADEMFKAPPDLRAEVLDQAAQARLLGGHPVRAIEISTMALAITPDDPDLMIDRAEAYAASGKYQEALADLDKAIAHDAHRVDALVFRAAAHRALQQLDPALRDAEAAVRASPDNPDALLERGNIRRLKGDAAGARKDWLRIAQIAPDSPAAQAAKANIEQLDVKQDEAPAGSAAPVRKPPP
jgi:tetratricopeptide (TPR) repeat protein